MFCIFCLLCFWPLQTPVTPLLWHAMPPPLYGGSLPSLKIPSHLGLHRQITILTQKLQADPSNLALRLRRAELYLRHEDLQMALQDLRIARRLRPDHPQIDLLQALTFAALGEAKAAEDAALRFLFCHPPQAALTLLLARFYRRTSATSKALSFYKATLTLHLRETPDLVLEFGEVYEAQRRWKDAEDLYRRAFLSFSKAVTLRLALLRVLRKQGRFEEALSLIDGILPTLPVRVDWLLRRASVLDALGRKAEARKDRVTALSEAEALVKLRPSSLNRDRLLRVRRLLGR